MKSDPIQGILFQEKTMRPVKPVARLRRNIRHLPEKIREFHRASKPINPQAPVANKETAELLGRLRASSDHK